MFDLLRCMGIKRRSSFDCTKMRPSVWRKLHKTVFAIVYKIIHYCCPSIWLIHLRMIPFIFFRWILECSPQGKSCPTCKSKVKQADIRPLYAKRVVCADKTEEYRLQDLLDAEKKKNIELHSELSSYKLQMAVLEDQKSKLEIENKKLKMNGTYEASQTPSYREIMYKMSKHRDIEISREGGCQALTYGRKIQTLIVSQKSSNRLFPGYGVRFIDTRTLQLAVFFRMSAKLIRDLSLNVEEELLAAASSDENAYIYSVRNRTSVATIRPLGDAGKIWTTSFDKVRPCNLHIGSQQGIIYTYDTRNYSSHFMELKIPGDDGPVIFIESIPISNDFRYGGFIVCKLKSLWFYEYNGSERIEQTKLAVDGPFVSVSYDEQSNILLITTRTKGKCSQQLIVAYLMKTGQTTVLRTICTIPGSSTNPKMQRNTQITIGNVSIVANYLQDKKLLGLWNARTGTSMQKLQVEDGILDMCPMNLDEGSFLATINEKKCRIFQLNPV